MGLEKLDDVRDSVKDYYGKQLKTSDDLQSNACVNPAQRMPKYIKDVLSTIHDEVVSKYFGCGLVVPACLEGLKVLDLGSGSGRDCYALSKLVGETGFVTGIDMTDEQLDVAKRHIKYHSDLFGYKQSNIKFVKGYIEDLKEADIKDDSIDLIVSNCVINLCKEKRKIFQEAYRVLKDGGEIYFSDVYADRRSSEEIRNNEKLWGEGIGGALYWKDLMEIAKETGFEKPRIVTLSSFNITKPELRKLIGDAQFASVVYRLFKLPSKSDKSNSEVIYNGSITGHEEEMKLDQQYTFKTNKAIAVDGETSAILKMSRFKGEFSFTKSSCTFDSMHVEHNPFVLLARGDENVVVPPSCSKQSKECS